MLTGKRKSGRGQNRILSAVVLLVALLGWNSCRFSSEASPEETPAAERPNILLIVADDMGYSDIGPYGGEIDTPALDALAEGGLQFTNFYTNNMCVPTRASMLTGVYHPRSYDESLTDRVVTAAELLGEAGYSTFMSGKWHLGPWSEQENDKTDWPLQRGFDRFFGTILGAASYFAPNSLVRGNQPAEDEYLQEDFYYTDAIGTNAVRFLRAAQAKENPFFGYVAFTAPHWPLHALPEDIAKYEGEYDRGWNKLRQRRYRRMIDLGVIDSSFALSLSHPKVPAWPELSPARKAWEARQMAVYAAQIDRMDQTPASWRRFAGAGSWTTR